MVLFFSCVDQIQLESPPGAEDQVVIEGFVERGDDYIFYARTGFAESLDGVFYNESLPGTIELIMDNVPVLEMESGLKYRINAQQFHSIYGGDPIESVFKLRVTTSEGTVYESTDEKVISVPKPESMKVELVEKEFVNNAGNVEFDDFVELFITTPVVNEQGEKVSLRWDVTGVSLFIEYPCFPISPPKSCYVKDSLAIFKVNVLNSDNVGGDQLTDFSIDFTDADNRFAFGYYYTVVQKSLSNEAAVFWQQVKESNPEEQDIFSVAPGSLSSNIRNLGDPQEKVLGFFYTSEVDTIRLGVRPDETGRQRDECIVPNSDACCDCIIIRNSSYERPEYWKF